MTEANGELIGGRYRLIELIGQGGMGRVWRGRDETLGRDVAIKEVTFPQGITAEQRDVLLQRVTREARAAARLNHPGIITVHDVVEHQGAPVIVMEYVTGISLASSIAQSGGLPVRTVAEIGTKMLQALNRAHASGIVHRDLKPDNVLLMDDRVIITDFGIAHMADSTTALTHTGTIIGTPAYMSPEQLAGKTPSAATDLWALGATLYSAVEGQPPFSAETFTALVLAVITEDPRPALRAGGLWPVLAALLTKDPAQRATAAQAQAALEQVERTGAAVPVPIPTQVDSAPSPGPHAAHQLPTQTGTPFAPPVSPGSGGTPASGTPRTLGRRSVLWLGLGGAAAVAGGIGIALKTGDHTPPKPKVNPWEYAVEGPRHDSNPPPFAVADGALYVSTEETIVALDARTGRKRWKGPSDFSREYRYRNPLVAADGAVYASGQIGTTYGLCALDADGRKKWFCSFADSDHRPVVTDGIVYIAAYGHVHAVHADNGRKLWSHPLGDKGSSGLAVADGTVYVSGGKALYALDAASGARKWAFPLDYGARLDQPPVVSGGLVYVLDDVTNLHALHAAEGTGKWWLKFNGQSLCAAGDMLYVTGGDVAENGIVHALDSSTGKRKWGRKVNSSQLSPTQLALAGDLLFVASTEDKDGTVYAVDTGDGSQRWSTGILEKLGSDMAAAYGFVYASVNGRVVALDAATGTAPT
ncbi:PQQ-binding-like beta-propeller repeat protein [Streptomyces sp. CB02959]|uniref:protein kinase domain-containing protein n=1 Tax=Streptomyces sp. CB02959 TaxID=2020330 RepID=UPI0011AF495C|nr:PQQ-binding-like beta-propeller repeat protein [Streptomyces sp. CB02959]